MSNTIHLGAKGKVALAGVATTAVGVATCAADHWLPGSGIALAGVTAAGLPAYLRFRPARTRAQINRHDRHTGRNAGTASWLDVARTSSRWAMYRRATVIRPSLTQMPWWDRVREPALSYATPLCKVGRQRVWLDRESSSLRVGPPGCGKTAELAGQVIDAPGGVLVTSTAADIYDLTSPLREQAGPVAVFNPSGLGGIPSTLNWSVLAGCEDPGVAMRRATDLIPQAGEAGGDGERWAAEGRRALAPLLHAAALGGYRAHDVQTWVSDPDKPEYRQLVRRALVANSTAAASMCRAADAFFETNPRTRDGVKLPMLASLAWLTQPAAAAVGDPVPEWSAPDAAPMWNVADLVDRRGTLYLLGDTDGVCAPLIAALTSEIVRQARAMAASRSGQRLDPGLTLVLDEVALICPIPLDRWLAELRKWSIAIHAAAQGDAQLRERWGDNGASMIRTCSAAVLVYGGCKDPADLRLFSDLAGQREVEKSDGNGTERVEVIPPSMLARLPKHHALLIRQGMPPALVRTAKAWQRRDVRAAKRQATRVVRTAERAKDQAQRAASKTQQTKTTVNA